MKSEVNIVQKDTVTDYISFLRKDTTKIPMDSIFSTRVGNGQQQEAIASLCGCGKNTKDNSVVIQIISTIPTQGELNDGVKDRSRILMDLGNPGSFKGQKKYLRLSLKDSTVESIQMLSKSTDLDYNNTDFDFMESDRYKIKISTFDYSVVSNISGHYEIILPREYGFIKNDTVVKGFFQCTNTGVIDFETIKNMDLNERNRRVRENWGIRVKN
ncbi:hypothetical protein POV27_11475 [Aureisphaera galaxeae]|uniref:hypothetical protein n=1 Tax=Aureisphaera galaxeae TaxID=1538023 RepID=UPI00234FEEF1|nr:hypothetical protein [Aureisphaera galaxeae]MDC8004672.1 hypothetical protein [Aureisphaera galaxeae]